MSIRGCTHEFVYKKDKVRLVVDQLIRKRAQILQFSANYSGKS